MVKFLGIRGKNAQADFIGNFLSTIPKPVLFLIFIFLLTLVASLLNPMFNTFGVFCKSDGSVVKLEESNIITNIGLLGSLPDADEIAGDTLDVDIGLFNVPACTEYYNGSDRYLDHNGCATCDYVVGFTSEKDASGNLCFGDATRTSNNDLNWIRRTITCPLDQCRIPEGYYYKQDINAFKCFGDCSSHTLSDKRDSKLDELGAIPLYASASDDSIKGFFQIGCNDRLKTELTLKGIPIFRLEYWAIGMLIMILLWAVIHFRKS